MMVGGAGGRIIVGGAGGWMIVGGAGGRGGPSGPWAEVM